MGYVSKVTMEDICWRFHYFMKRKQMIMYDLEQSLQVFIVERQFLFRAVKCETVGVNCKVIVGSARNECTYIKI